MSRRSRPSLKAAIEQLQMGKSPASAGMRKTTPTPRSQNLRPAASRTAVPRTVSPRPMARRLTITRTKNRNRPAAARVVLRFRAGTRSSSGRAPTSFSRLVFWRQAAATQTNWSGLRQMRQKWDLRLGGRCRAVQPDEFERVRWHDAGIHHGALIAHRDNDITQDVQGPLFHDAKKPQADRFFARHHPGAVA